MEVANHNATVLGDLEVGDLIEVKRGFYSHWAVYIGDSRVVHMTATDTDRLNANSNSGHVFSICGTQFNKVVVKEDDFWDVVGKRRAYNNNSKDRKLCPYERLDIVARALSKLGEIGFDVLWNNCEHFASWCRYGIKWSEQANKFLSGAAVGAYYFLSIVAVILAVILIVVAILSGQGKQENNAEFYFANFQHHLQKIS